MYLYRNFNKIRSFLLYIHFDTNILKSVRHIQQGVWIILSLYKVVEKLPSFMLQLPGFLLSLCINPKP